MASGIGIRSAKKPAKGGEITSPNAWIIKIDTANAVAAIFAGTAEMIAVLAGAKAAKINS